MKKTIAALAAALLCASPAFAASPVTVTGPTGTAATVTGSNALKVDGSAVTQPVSGTVTTTPSGTQNVNNAQVSGTTVSTGNGATDAGTQRVTISSDSTGKVAAVGPTADGSAASTPPVLIGGTSDGGPTGTVGVVKVDTSGFLYDIPTPLRSTTTDRGVTITTGGTSQQLAASNTARNRITIQNPTSATGQGISVAENCQVNFGAAASQTAGTSFDLSSGGSFDSGAGPVPTDAVNVVCATTGHKVIAKEW